MTDRGGTSALVVSAPAEERKGRTVYLVDLNDGKALSLPDLHREWQELRKEDPENHAETFILEFFQILDATLRGRNDCEIEGLTGAEVFRMYKRLMTIC